MFKKAIFALFFVILAPASFAIDRNELNVEFFNSFNDPYLYCYINEALEHNHSAKQATYRVEQYRQQVKVALGRELPSLSVGANYLGTHTPSLGSIGSFNLDESALIMPFIASWEPDFLLKNRDKTKSAKKSYEISAQEEKAIYLTLLSDVATVYTNILQYDELIKHQEENIKIAQDILSANIKKYERGVIDNTTLNTFERGTLDNFEYQSTIPSEIPSDVIFSRRMF